VPNSIPDVTGAATRIPYSIRYIDHTGDKRADALTGFDTTNVTPANIQALNVAMGGATNAEMYEGVIGDVFGVVPDKSNANVADRSEVVNNIVVLAKNAAGASVNLFIPAPVPALFVTGSDEIDPASTELAAVFTALLALLPTGFEIVSARYTSRKQYNAATPI